MRGDWQEWFRVRPMVVFFVPLALVILLCYYTERPFDLLYATEVDYIDSLQTYEVVVADYPSPRKKTLRYTADVLSIVDTTIVPSYGRTYLYIVPDSTRSMPTRGDTLLVRTRIRRGEQMGGFDYGQYLRLQGIVGQGVVWSNQWCLVSPARPTVMGTAVDWQYKLVERYRRYGIREKELGTLTALTLGYKEDLDANTKRSFQVSGAAHVLAVSGLHTGIIYAVLLSLLTFGGRWKPLYTQWGRRIVLSLTVIGAMWVYAAMTGMTPSVVRSVVMLTLVEVGRMLYRHAYSLNIVAAAAVLILLVRPTDLFSVSFQLSFAAVVAILVIGIPLQKVLPIYRIPSKILRGCVQYIWDIMAISIAAQLGTLPLTLYYFGQCSNYFLLTNMLVIPLAWLIVVGGMMVLALGGVPFIGGVVVWATNGLVSLLNYSVGWIEGLPGSNTTMRISILMILLLYGAIASGCLGLRRSLWWHGLTAICLILFCYFYAII